MSGIQDIEYKHLIKWRFLEGALPKNEERNLANIIRYTSKAALKYDSELDFEIANQAKIKAHK